MSYHDVINALESAGVQHPEIPEEALRLMKMEALRLYRNEARSKREYWEKQAKEAEAKIKKLDSEA